jgi:hypothetical protein
VVTAAAGHVPAARIPLTPRDFRIVCGPPSEEITVARRSKRSLKSRPKHKRDRSLKDRRMKARKKAAHKRGIGRNKARRQRRGKKK